ncbi:MAG: branched-chain amino acid ABC transporter permease [Candidatus Bathyarchaeia archaeon]
MFKLGIAKILLVLLILIFFALAPFLVGDYYMSIFRSVLMWAALAISWHFFSGLTRYVALGSAAFFGTGLYFTAKYLQFSVDYTYLPSLPLPIILLLAGLINFALALAIGLVTLRLKGIYFAILTFGVSEVFKNIFQWWEIRITGTRGTYISVLFDSQTVYYSIFVTAFVIFFLTALLRKSRFGLALRMVGDCEEAAVHVGVNTSLFKTFGFAVSAMCIGLMGACLTTRFTYINTDIAFNAEYSFLPAIMTLLGGAGTVYGPMIGSVTIYLLSHYLGVAYAQYFQIILGLILVAIVLFMPNGIMGMVTRLKSAKSFRRKELAKVPKKLP